MSSTTSNLLTTHLTPLSPLLSFSPCISSSSRADCTWTTGWLQGWNNSGPWDASSLRWAEAWSTSPSLPPTVSLSFQGNALSLNFQETSYYNLSLSINGSRVWSEGDLVGSGGWANATGLPRGIHQLEAVFRSKDSTREPSQEGVARLLGIEISQNGTSVNSSLIPEASISYSAGWNHMSTTDRTGRIINATEATILEPLLSGAQNSSLSWTVYNGSSLTFSFTGNYLTLLSPLTSLLALGSFSPSIDSVTYPSVDLSSNLLPYASDASSSPQQVVWHQALAEDGLHTFTMRNEGASVMLVDAFLFGSVDQSPISIPSASSTLPSSSSTARPSSTPILSSSPASFFQNGSSSIGVIIAIIVLGLGLLGLLLLLLWKRFRPSPASPSSNDRRSGIGGLNVKPSRFSQHLSGSSPYSPGTGNSTRSFAPLVNYPSRSGSALALDSSTSTSQSNAVLASSSSAVAAASAPIWHDNRQSSQPFNDSRLLPRHQPSHDFPDLLPPSPRRPEFDAQSRQSSVNSSSPLTVIPPKRIGSHAGEIGDMLAIPYSPNYPDEVEGAGWKRGTMQTTGTGSVYSLGESYFTLDDEAGDDQRGSRMTMSGDGGSGLGGAGRAFRSMSEEELVFERDNLGTSTPPADESAYGGGGGGGVGEEVEMRRRNHGADFGTPEVGKVPAPGYF